MISSLRGGSGGVSFVGVDTADLDRRSGAGLSLSVGDDGGGSALGAPGDLALAAAADGDDGESGTRGGLEEEDVRRGRGGWGWDEGGPGVRSRSARSLAVMGDMGAGLPLSGPGLGRAADDMLAAECRS